MTGVRAPVAAIGRTIGTWDRGRPGPTLLVVAGMHGNEPAGVVAAQRVLERLQQQAVEVVGRVVALAGNLGALRQGRRFLQRDFNRGWTAEALARLQRLPDGELGPEDREQRELLAAFERVLAEATGPVLVVDLHSSSAPGPPFLCLADTIDNRRLGLATGIAIILGIEETIDGAAIAWFGDRGVVALAAEGGRHDDPHTADNHEALLWLLLTRVGIVPPGIVDTAAYRRHLARAGSGVPPIVEIVRRHAITPEDRFAMAPGFTNFARAPRGTLLAHDRRGEIRAERDSVVLLPLYQAQGDDGFFLARPVRPFWLGVARWLRALQVDRVLPFLPGVRRDPGDPDTLLADRRVARWFTVEVFHLLGFRKERPRGGLLAFSRRRSLPANRRL